MPLTKDQELPTGANWLRLPFLQLFILLTAIVLGRLYRSVVVIDLSLHRSHRPEHSDVSFLKLRAHSSFFLIVDINPNGRSYASGAEDGYVRLHIFDKDYLDMKDPVPEEDEEEEDSQDEAADDDKPSE